MAMKFSDLERVKKVRTWSNAEIADHYLQKAGDQKKFRLPFRYVKTTEFAGDLSSYWLDYKLDQVLTVNDMKEVFKHILFKFVYYIDLVIDKIGTSEEDFSSDDCVEWAVDEVRYINNAVRHLLSEDNYSDVNLDCLDSNFWLFVNLSQLEKNFLDLFVELSDCENDLEKLTNFINCSFRGIRE